MDASMLYLSTGKKTFAFFASSVCRFVARFPMKTSPNSAADGPKPHERDAFDACRLESLSFVQTFEILRFPIAAFTLGRHSKVLGTAKDDAHLATTIGDLEPYH